MLESGPHQFGLFMIYHTLSYSDANESEGKEHNAVVIKRLPIACFGLAIGYILLYWGQFRSCSVIGDRLAYIGLSLIGLSLIGLSLIGLSLVWGGTICLPFTWTWPI